MRENELDHDYRRFRRHGDVEALGRVFDAAAPELLGLARHLTPGEADAEDAVQGTFLVAIERAADFDERQRLMPWLLGVLVNRVRGARRKGRRERGPALEAASVEAGGVAAACADDPAAPARERELSEVLRAALTRVPETYRGVLARHLLDELPPREVARELGLSPNTARVRLHRGLELLRRALPAGLAGGAAVVLSPAARAASLARLRPRVLARAAAAAPDLAARGTTTGAGVRLLVLTLTLVAALGAAWRTWASPRWGDEMPAIAAPSPRAPEPESALAPSPARTLPSPAEGRRSAVTERRVATLVRFSGRVVDHHTGAELAQVEVTTERAGRRAPRATTDARGRFTFEAAPSEERSLRLEAPGYAPLVLPLAADRLERFREVAGRAAGEARVSYGELRMWPGAEVTGRVLDAEGRGVAGAELDLFWHDDIGGLRHRDDDRPVGRSDARGAFQLIVPRCLPSGESSALALLAVTPDGIGWSRLVAPAGAGTLEGVELVLEPGIDLELEVHDEDGAPLVGARVRAISDAPPFDWPALSSFVPRFFPAPPALQAQLARETGADGATRFPHLPRSRRAGLPFTVVDVRAELTGYLPAEERLFLLDSASEPARATLTLRTAPARSLSGTVVRPDGAPVSRATVHFGDGRDARATRTDADGRFTLVLDERTPTPLILHAEAAGHAPFQRPWSASDELDLEPLVLEPARPTSGRVVDQAGRPLPYLSLSARREHHGGTSYVAEVTDEEGRFRFASTAAELYAARIRLPTGSWKPGTGTPSFEGGRDDVLLVLERDLAPRGKVVLDVLDAETGAPLDAERVDVADASGWRPDPRDIARRRGAVELSRLPLGRYAVWIAAPGRAPARVELDVRGDTYGQVLAGPPSALRGRVTGATAGEVLLLEARLVGVEHPTGWKDRARSFQCTARCAADGSFLLAGLVPGRWRLRASAGARAVTREVELRAGATGEALLELDE